MLFYLLPNITSPTRLSFWLSNCVVLRAIVSETSKQSNSNAINNGSKTGPRRNSASMWESLNRKKGKLLSPEFDNWEDVDTFIAALKKIESWIFSRIVESIWWQVCLVISSIYLLFVPLSVRFVKYIA